MGPSDILGIWETAAARWDITYFRRRQFWQIDHNSHALMSLTAFQLQNLDHILLERIVTDRISVAFPSLKAMLL